MKSLSNNLLKSYWVVVQNNETRIIDSNTRMEQKLNNIKSSMHRETRQEEIAAEEFEDGLEACQINALLGESNTTMANDETQGETSSQIIKAEPAERGPEPEELMEQAREQIDIMMAQAQADAEEIKQQAYEAGHEEGYQAGHLECVQQTEKMKQELQQKEERLESFYQQKLEELEPQMVDLLTDIYEHVFHIKLSDFKEIILYSINHVLGMADGNKDFIIRVSQYDYPFISEQKKEIKEKVSANATLEIVEDITMSQGECLIETGGGIFDCSIDTQLEGLSKELRLLSYEKV